MWNSINLNILYSQSTWFSGGMQDKKFPPVNDHLSKDVISVSSKEEQTRMLGKVQNSSSPTIKWEDYNYPPFLKFIHFTLDEFNGPQRALAQYMHWAFLLIPIVSLLSFVNSIAQTAAGVPGYSGINILYAIFNILLFNPPALFVFYKGLRGISGEGTDLFLYKVLQGAIGSAWIIFSFLYFHSINGFIHAVKLLSGTPFQGLLAFLEALGFLASGGLGFYCIWKTV